MSIFTPCKSPGRNNVVHLILALCLFAPGFGMAQTFTYNMTAGTNSLTGTAPTVYNFYDPGGSGGNACGGSGVAPDYANNLDITETFTASTGQNIVVTFTSGFFGIGTGDYLYIYDGPNTSSTLLATYGNNTTTTPPVWGSTSNSLTFRFTSDGSLSCKGWVATLTTNYFMQPGTYSLNCATTYFTDPSSTHQPTSGSTVCPGSSTNDYNDNSNYVETLCTGGTQYITATWNPSTPVNSNPFCICSGDVLNVYDGNSTSASLLQTYTNTLRTGSITSGSTTISGLASTSGLATGWYVSSPSTGIPFGATISSIGANSIVISSSATATNAAITLDFTPTAVSSTGSCMTFEFTSDASSHSKGWNASLTCTTIVVPTNDNCTSATTVATGSPCTSIAGTVQSSTASGSPSVSCGTATHDVWYAFTATTTSPTITVVGTGGSMRPCAQLCVGPSSGPTQSTLGGTVINCAAAALGTATLSPTNLTTGTTYYVRVYDYNGNSSSCTFTICIDGATQQDCAGATIVNSYFTLSGTATSYGTQEYSSSTFGCLVGGEHRSLWYKMKVTSPGTIAFSLTPTASQDIDFAIWGPYASSSCSNITGSPLRCTFAANGGSVGGLSDSYFDASETASGDGWLRSIGCPTCTSTYGETAVAANQWYIFLIDGWSSFNGSSLSLTWTGTATLPIVLTDFTGEAFFDYNGLYWTTASEINNAYWTIERSADGETFEKIATLEGAGNSTVAKNYKYFDHDPLNGNNYYRLKQTDTNGSETYSNVVLLANFGNTITVQNIYPNPTNGEIHVDLYSSEDYDCTVKVVNQLGREVMNDKRTLEQGGNSLMIDLAKYEKGVYYLQLHNSHTGDILTRKIVKM